MLRIEKMNEIQAKAREIVYDELIYNNRCNAYNLKNKVGRENTLFYTSITAENKSISNKKLYIDTLISLINRKAHIFEVCFRTKTTTAFFGN